MAQGNKTPETSGKSPLPRIQVKSKAGSKPATPSSLRESPQQPSAPPPSSSPRPLAEADSELAARRVELGKTPAALEDQPVLPSGLTPIRVSLPPRQPDQAGPSTLEVPVIDVDDPMACYGSDEEGYPGVPLTPEFDLAYLSSMIVTVNKDLSQAYAALKVMQGELMKDDNPRSQTVKSLASVLLTAKEAGMSMHEALSNQSKMMQNVSKELIKQRRSRETLQQQVGRLQLRYESLKATVQAKIRNTARPTTTPGATKLSPPGPSVVPMATDPAPAEQPGLAHHAPDSEEPRMALSPQAAAPDQTTPFHDSIRGSHHPISAEERHPGPSPGKRARTMPYLAPDPEAPSLLPMVEEYTLPERLEFSSRRLRHAIDEDRRRSCEATRSVLAYRVVVLCRQVFTRELPNLPLGDGLTPANFRVYAEQHLPFIPPGRHHKFMDGVEDTINTQRPEHYFSTVQVIKTLLTALQAGRRTDAEEQYRRRFDAYVCEIHKDVTVSKSNLRRMVAFARTMDELCYHPIVFDKPLWTSLEVAWRMCSWVVPQDCGLRASLEQAYLEMPADLSPVEYMCSILNVILRDSPHLVVHYPRHPLPEALLPRVRPVTYMITNQLQQRPFQVGTLATRRTIHCNVCYRAYFEGNTSVLYQHHTDEWCPAILGIWDKANPACNPGPRVTEEQNNDRILHPPPARIRTPAGQSRAGTHSRPSYRGSYHPAAPISPRAGVYEPPVQVYRPTTAMPPQPSPVTRTMPARETPPVRYADQAPRPQPPT